MRAIYHLWVSFLTAFVNCWLLTRTAYSCTPCTRSRRQLQFTLSEGCECVCVWSRRRTQSFICRNSDIRMRMQSPWSLNTYTHYICVVVCVWPYALAGWLTSYIFKWNETDFICMNLRISGTAATEDRIGVIWHRLCVRMPLSSSPQTFLVWPDEKCVELQHNLPTKSGQ